MKNKINRTKMKKKEFKKGLYVRPEIKVYPMENNKAITSCRPSVAMLEKWNGEVKPVMPNAVTMKNGRTKKVLSPTSLRSMGGVVLPPIMCGVNKLLIHESLSRI